MDNLSLYYGDNLKVFDNLEVKHPKLIDIKKIGYETYNHYIFLLTMTPVDIADVLWFDMKVWYEQLTQWQLILQLYNTDENILKAFEWFTGYKFNIVTDNTYYYLATEDQKIVINEHVFMNISQFIRDINFIPTKNDLELAGNKRTKLYLLEQYNKKRKKNKKEKINLASIVSSVDWKSCRGNEIWDYPIYKIYEGYMRLNTIDNYDKTMIAYYSGNIDTSKTKIDFDKINWSNAIII